MQCICLTLMQQQLLQLQELFLSDWVRVPLTFSHFTETVLKRPSQSPDFMAKPSQGPTDLMDITRINQTFMPTRSSTVGDEAWLRVEEWHDLDLRSVCACQRVCLPLYVSLCVTVCLQWCMSLCVLAYGRAYFILKLKLHFCNLCMIKGLHIGVKYLLKNSTSSAEFN